MDRTCHIKVNTQTISMHSEIGSVIYFKPSLWWKRQISTKVAFIRCKRNLMCFKLNQKCVSSPLKLQDTHAWMQPILFSWKKEKKLQHYSRKIFPSMLRSHCPTLTPTPIKNGFYRIVSKCSHWTKTSMPLSTVAIYQSWYRCRYQYRAVWTHHKL